MKISFHGAAGEVTGSSFLVTTAKTKVLIDCGFYQGKKTADEKNQDPFGFDVGSVTSMVLTHAHLDHCGRIPKLWKDGFRGKIYATPATRDLAELIMNDTANIMLHELEEDGEQPIYDAEDVAAVMPLFVPIDYHTKTTIAPGVTAELFDAGHILGSASVTIEAEGKKIVFSGDIGNHPVPIIREPELPLAADYLVMESTYGGRLHDSPIDRRMKLRQVVCEAANQKGALLIPAFALERTQELLYEFNELISEQLIPPLTIYLDSPLAIKATRVYEKYPQYYDESADLLKQPGEPLLNFPNLVITETPGQSKEIYEHEGPKIIIAGSGMMEGGRITHHARHYLPDPRTILLMVGYQGTGTLGRAIYDGNRHLKIRHEWTEVKARVLAIGAYSGHADQAALVAWTSKLKQPPQKTFLVHGEPDQAKILAGLLAKQNHIVEQPVIGDEVEL
jgi:metallo-beta-lactamase family protein